MYNKNYYEANKARIAIQQKRYRDANKDLIKHWFKANNERLKIQAKRYYEANKERIAIREKQYREANKERIKRYCEANKERTAIYAKRYCAANQIRVINRYYNKNTCGGELKQIVSAMIAIREKKRLMSEEVKDTSQVAS